MESHRYLMCLHCPQPVFLASIEDLKRHITVKHGLLASYTCRQCKKQFWHKTSLIRHIQEKHVKCVDHPSSSRGPGPSTMPTHAQPMASGTVHEPNVVQDEMLFDLPGRESDEEIESRTADKQPSKFDLKYEAAKFLMKLRSSGNITGASVSVIQDHVHSLLQGIVNDLSAKTSDHLEELKESPDNILKFLSETFKVDNPFLGLLSTEDQLDYFSEKFGLVKPMEKCLDYRIEHRLDSQTKMFLPTQVPETYQSMSLIGTLKLFIRQAYWRNLVLAEQPSEDGVFRNYKDGTDFKNNSFLQKYPYALRLVLNYDDLEVANGLGAKDVIHKLGCFYVCVQNLPPEEASKLSAIFMLALTYAEDLKKKGAFGKVMLPLVEELKILKSDEGVLVDLPEGGTFILRACLVDVCADSLAAHALMGFLSPSANLFCRCCMVTKDDLRNDSTAMGQIRTSRLTERHVNEVKRNPRLSSKYGVREKSALSEVINVPEDSVFDAFHDLVGIIQMILKLALYEFICVRNLFSVFDFNSNLKTFCYGAPDIKNKPSANVTRERLTSKGHTLKQSGSQTFCLLRIFPFLITGVREDDKYLKLVFLLQDIVQIIFSFELRGSDIDRLETLIYQHNKLFHEIFISPPLPEEVSEEDDNGDSEEVEEENVDDDFSEGNIGNYEDDGIESDELEEEAVAGNAGTRRRNKWKSKRLKKGINKLHHLMHYPAQMREKGPLIRLWCARYSEFIKSFKSVCPVLLCALFNSEFLVFFH